MFVGNDKRSRYYEIVQLNCKKWKNYALTKKKCLVWLTLAGRIELNLLFSYLIFRYWRGETKTTCAHSSWPIEVHLIETMKETIFWFEWKNRKKPFFRLNYLDCEVAIVLHGGSHAGHQVNKLTFFLSFVN